MSGETLSQEEINALLNGMDADPQPEPSDEMLTSEEIDALGEVGNISMGTAATTLFTLLNHKVKITTPTVEILTIDEFKSRITDNHIAVSVGYTVGLTGTNLMILEKEDVKIITDLMMGGSGVASDEPINELHLSAISEAMNQMIGSSSTSLSQMFDKKIDISPPSAIELGSAKEHLEQILGSDNPIAKISFRMQIDDNIIDSELMQILPMRFAKDLVKKLMDSSKNVASADVAPEPAPTPTPVAQPTMQQQMPQGQPVMHQQQMMYDQPMMHQQPMMNHQSVMNQQTMSNVHVKQAAFPQFDQAATMYPSDNMNVLLDVSLEVSVELGRSRRKIREILEYGPGSLIELDRLVGEQIDILVNGKFIAKGEVVVIDENFGVRITDIINPENRI